MKTKWDTQHRAVLVRLVADYEAGVRRVDPAAYASTLRLTPAQVHDSLRALRDGALALTRTADNVVVELLSVSPLARDITAAGRDRTAARAPVPLIDEVVLRATVGP